MAFDIFNLLNGLNGQLRRLALIKTKYYLRRWNIRLNSDNTPFLAKVGQQPSRDAAVIRKRKVKGRTGLPPSPANQAGFSC